MSTLAAFRAMTDQLIGYFGDSGTITLRRRHGLKNSVAGKATNALLVHGAHASGVAVISFRGTNLEGRLPQGVKFQIGATVYTVSSPITAASGILSAVTFAPVLAANAADGAAVTITQPYGDKTLYRFRGASLDTEVEGAEVERRRLHLSSEGVAAMWTPEPGDLVLDGTLDPQAIQDVIPVMVGAGPARWTVLLGDAA